MSLAPRYDVAIIGAGIAGLAASVLLRKAGLSVVCLDVQAYPHRKVGESLDWSSPGLLRRVGIDVDALIADEIATYKKNIVVCELGKNGWKATPPPAIRRRPLRFETVTLHVDRAALDARLFDHASALGTAFIWERVTSVDTTGERVTGCSTAAGRRVEARWYIDASGTARVLSRAMGIPIVAYGRQKVCLWTYFDTPPLHDGTAFFVDNRDAYLSWVWDIPISPTQTSVGFVLPAETMAARRRAGGSVATDSPRRAGAPPTISQPARRAVRTRSREHLVSGLRHGEGLRRQLAHDRRSGVDAGPADRQWRDFRHPPRAPRGRRDPDG